MQHAALKLAAPLAAAAVTLLVTASLRAEPLYPEVVNTSHATPQAAAFFKSYFTAKSEQTRVSGDMHPAVVAFTDTPELFGGEIRIPFRAVLAKSLAGQVFARESR